MASREIFLCPLQADLFLPGWLLLLKMLLSCPKRSITHFLGSWCPCGHAHSFVTSHTSTAFTFYAMYHRIISIIWGEKSRSSGGMHSVPKCRERDQQVHEHVLAGWPQCLRDAVTLFTSF